jgi:Fe2+ or Zn2+ uptake regulation protein
MMSKQYLSKYSNGKEISAAQYITEIICEKKAKITNKDVHYRFWLTDEWEKYYKNQIPTAHKLLKKYSDTAIIRALQHDKAKKIYSLRAPHLIPIIEQEERAMESENKNISIALNRTEKTSFRKTTQNNNIISRLKDLDHGS